ncbi:class I adenylate-forming enzyme family protein [Actinomadura madurae]|uniref:2-succinylbenzoyl-CoA synthetase n=1 Tax=Actinomadura madurae TaxID=1993 RepID=A0A1I5M7N0_9ACTN|nr:AMP-binding protein [Actinomadura madurae]SFP05612.1 2-succinylbenzoyl-CoA synthetase [Actinomadura madurae]SPT52356.1 Long-chain-fatty-acid--CoA ligase [Actinomadura madurae]
MSRPRLTASLAYWSSRTPDSVALECEGTTLTWRGLADSVEAVAHQLRDGGLAAGDRIGYLCENGAGVIQTILAAAALDAIVVPLNVRLTTPELSWIVEDAGLSALLTDQAFADRSEELAQRHDLRVYWREEAAPDWAAPLTREGTDSRELLSRVTSTEDLPVFICYTSGTTGRPKGAVLTHGNAIAAATSFSITETMTRFDTCLLVLPLAFTGSIMATWAPTYYSGARFVMHRRFDASRTLAELEHGGVTVFPAVPVVFEQLAALDRFDGADLSTVRVAKAGGAPPSAATLRRYEDRGIPIGQGYGMTESSGVGTSLPQEDFERKAGSAGVVNFGTDLSIRDAEGAPLPPGEVGEICLRGPSIMSGYWGDPDATAETLAGGWLHTGDLGLLDGDGYLTIMGREKDMVLSGGLNVYPSEIERVLLLDERVREAAVVAVPDDRWGEVPAAIVVTDDAGLGPDPLLALCRDELADYKIPKYFSFTTDPLPRTMSGKVAKADLRDRAAKLAGLPPSGPEGAADRAAGQG